MARMPGATWSPVANHDVGGMDAYDGVVLHIMDGTLMGTQSWFNNPAAQASSHFGVGKTGEILQWVDTADRAWAEAGGNSTYLSIEHEGYGGDVLTDAQLHATAAIVAWAHSEHGIPLQDCDAVGAKGLAYHSLGGALWGGHYDCPGAGIVAQRAQILSLAGAAPAAPSGSTPARYQVVINGLRYGYGASGPQVTEVGKALVAKGCGSHYTVGPGPDWSDADTLNYSEWQQKCGYTGTAADGVPGVATLRLLLGSLPSGPAAPQYQPFPGVSFFHAAPSSAIITAMGERLVAEGCSAYVQGPGPQWTDADRRSYARWQVKCGFSGSAADGWPGQETWGLLQVPLQ